MGETDGIGAPRITLWGLVEGQALSYPEEHGAAILQRLTRVLE